MKKKLTIISLIILAILISIGCQKAADLNEQKVSKIKSDVSSIKAKEQKKIIVATQRYMKAMNISSTMFSKYYVNYKDDYAICVAIPKDRSKYENFNAFLFKDNRSNWVVDQEGTGITKQDIPKMPDELWDWWGSESFK